MVRNLSLILFLQKRRCRRLFVFQEFHASSLNQLAYETQLWDASSSTLISTIESREIVLAMCDDNTLERSRAKAFIDEWLERMKGVEKMRDFLSCKLVWYLKMCKFKWCWEVNLINDLYQPGMKQDKIRSWVWSNKYD